MASNLGNVTLHFDGDDKNLKTTMKSIDGSLNSFNAKAVAIGNLIYAGITKAISGMVDLGSQAVKSFASYEQLTGGVETLFKDSADTLMKYAEDSYIRAGVSANKYMEITTSFSASLLQSLQGDTAQAVQYADMAIVDMSDNANKMGTSIEMIQSAYQGFAKQNYTMLDNLKLGYGGTKTEMERLIEDANKLREAQGLAGDLTIQSYADIVTAIHEVQTEMGITGTTQKEASTTIEGSLNSVKGAWENFMTALGSGQGLDTAINNLITSITTFMSNLGPVLENVANGIVQALPQIINAIVQALPKFIEAGIKIILALLQGIGQALPQIITSLVDGIVGLIPTIIQAIPQFIQAGIQIVIGLITGILQALPQIIVAIAEAIPMIITTIANAIPMVITALTEALPQIITAITEAIPMIINAIINAIPQIIEATITAIPLIVQALIQAIPQILGALWQIFTAILGGIGEALANIGTKLWEWLKTLPEKITQRAQATMELIKNVVPKIVNFFKELPGKIWTWLLNTIQKIAQWGVDMRNKAVEGIRNVVTNVINGFKELPNKIKEVGKNLIQGLWNGINNAKQWVIDKIKGLGSSIMSAIKGIFGVHSPSVEFAYIGKMNMLGLEEGMENEQKKVQSQIDGMFNLEPNISQTMQVAEPRQDIQSAMQNMILNLQDRPISLDIRADEGIIVKKATEGFKDYVRKTGTLPFPVMV